MDNSVKEKDKTNETVDKTTVSSVSEQPKKRGRKPKKKEDE